MMKIKMTSIHNVVLTDGIREAYLDGLIFYNGCMIKQLNHYRHKGNGLLYDENRYLYGRKINPLDFKFLGVSDIEFCKRHGIAHVAFGANPFVNGRYEHNGE